MANSDLGALIVAATAWTVFGRLDHRSADRHLSDQLGLFAALPGGRPVRLRVQPRANASTAERT